MKICLLSFLVIVVFLGSPSFAYPPGDWWGTVTIECIDNIDDSTVSAHINNASESIANSTIGDLKSGHYLMHIEAGTGNIITFKVNGLEVEQSPQQWSAGEHSQFDLSVFIPDNNKFINDNISLTENILMEINASENVGVILNILTKENITNSSIEILKYPEAPVGEGILGLIGLGKYIGIEAPQELKNNIVWVFIKVYYTDDELPVTGIDENSLKMYYWNETINEWTLCENTGVDIDANYVWANVTHFSHYGSFGSSPNQEPPPKDENKDVGGGGNSGGGATPTTTCTEDWTCTGWSSCVNNKQTRSCTDQNDCGTEKSKPTESKVCEIGDETPEEVLTQDISDTEEEEEVITPTEGITQGNVGPTGLATAGVSKDSRNLGIILIVVIVISLGVFLSRKKTM